jgi:hypothetical protein
MALKVPPKYGAINAVSDICLPWIELHGGDEWGESMLNLHRACHTNYGFTNEDCALFAGKLYDNLVNMVYYLVTDGEAPWGYGHDEESGRRALAATQRQAREARDYWLSGGSPSSNETTMANAKIVIDQMPRWLFEDADIPEGY